MSEINIIVPKDLQEKDSDDDSIIINEDVFYQKDQDESEDESIIWNEDQEGECSFLIKRKDTNSGKKKLNTNKNVTKIKKEEKSNIKKLSDSYINSLYQNISQSQNNNKSNNDQAKIISKKNHKNLHDIQNQNNTNDQKNTNEKSADNFIYRVNNYKNEKLSSVTATQSKNYSPHTEKLNLTIPKIAKKKIEINSNSLKNPKKFANKISNIGKKSLSPKINNEKKKIYYKKINQQSPNNNENNIKPNLLYKPKKPAILNVNKRNINIKKSNNNQYYNSQNLSLNKSDNESKENFLKKNLDNNSNPKRYKKNSNNTLTQSLNQKKFNYISNSINDIKNIKNKYIITQHKNELVNSTSKKKNKIKNINNSTKTILINKINNKIDIIISKKKDDYSFFNPNKNLCFIGFCDILFDLGFLHVKESSIEDITKIDTSLKDLETQPYTDKNILTKEFLFNEQMLLISAWKTIKNNFNLVTKFDNLPQENEEISVNDMKLFILIITGLYNGNKKHFSESANSKNNEFLKENNNSNKKISVNNSSNDFSTVNNKIIKRNFNNQNICNKSLYLNSDELIRVLEYGKIINYRNISKLRYHFKYFTELQKLNDLYNKELKDANKIYNSYKKKYTFKPKINKNDKILLCKFEPSMDFLERNEIIKKRKEQKLNKLERARSQDLLKECTFSPAKITKKQYSNFKNFKNKGELSDKLNKNITNISQNIKSSNNIFRNDNLKNNPQLYSTTVIPSKRNNSNPPSKNKKTNQKKIKEQNSKENKIYSETRTELKKSMFLNSPLKKDELLKRRIMELRDNNFKKVLNIYENNSREIISNKIKNNFELLKSILEADKGNMRLDIEQKSNKDTFDKYKNPKFNDYNALLNDEDNEPLFTVEIKIKNNIKTIEVFPDNIPEKLAYEFCVENNLGKTSYEKIFNVIKTKLDEINGNVYLNSYGVNYYGNNYINNNYYQNNINNYYQGNLQNNNQNNFDNMQNKNNTKFNNIQNNNDQNNNYQNNNIQNKNFQKINNEEKYRFQEMNNNIEDKAQNFNIIQKKCAE